MTDFATSQTAKALKVIAALNQVAAESRPAFADVFELARDMPMVSLARLYDLLREYDTAAEAIASVEAA